MADSTYLIIGVAAEAGGVCTRSELLAAGLATSTIDRHLRSGGLSQIIEGLYEVPGLAGPDTRLHRALKVCGGGALSGLTAARLWSFPVPPPLAGEPVEVTVPFGQRAQSPLDGVAVRATRRWMVDHLAEPKPGLVATGPARTIVDLAGTAIGQQRLRHVIQTQVVAKQLSLGELAATLAQVGSRGVAGAGRLRRMIDQLDDGQPLPASILERRLGRLLDRRRFRRQYRPPWYDGVRGVVDFAAPDARLVVEADGRRWHGTEQAMVDDRRRDRHAVTHGWLVLRFTWDDVVDRPEATAAEIAAVVASRSHLRSVG